MVIEPAHRCTEPHSGICWGMRRIPFSYSTHIPGRVAYRPAARSIDVESRLESEVVHHLIEHEGLLGIFPQPFTLHAPRQRGGGRYTPDLLVVIDQIRRPWKTWGFGLWTVIEVKPHSKYLKHRAQIDARLAWVERSLGMRALCLTETLLKEETQ